MIVPPPSNYWWVVPFISFLAALVGAGGAFLGLQWRFRADYRQAILTKLLVDIQTAADMATECWLLKPSNDLEKCRGLEAKILGYTERLESNIEAARPFLHRIDTLGMDRPWATFLDAVSGGQFEDPGREPDYQRAKDVQYAAAKLVRDLRQATNRRLLGG